MAGKEEQTEYEANDADALVSRLFSGKLSTQDALQLLRTRLLDLSPRNRLLNYRHPKGRCVQFADKPDLRLLFERLFDSKRVLIKGVPEPSPRSYERKRPEAKQHAEILGIDTSFEFPVPPVGPHLGRRLSGLQALYYPADLERLLRKTSTEAKSSIDETGTNMLFLVFGFLEFYESDDSELPLLAPILSLPVTLGRGDIDIETRVYNFYISHNGEDLAENHTLREKFKQDFSLNLPEVEEDDDPETYFRKIEQVINTKRRWRVRRQLTLGFLSFAKLAIWADLDLKRNPRMLQHELLKKIFEGSNTGGGDGLFAKEYKIDERPESDLHIIYDADSSQHNAIIDVLSGKNIVINGPPGTGKSQTITNVIASALSKGKKVLFVSEKLAALEVVQRRLDNAGLGHFCLELHSHRSRKKRLIEDIRGRLEQKFAPPANFDVKLASLQRQKRQLARHAALIGSVIGNCLGLTVNEIFWAAERRRQTLGNLATFLYPIVLPESHKWTLDEITSRRSKMEAVGEVYEVIEKFDSRHPWWGFWPNSLAPSDDVSIGAIIGDALRESRVLDKLAEEYKAFLGDEKQLEIGSIEDTLAKLRGIPEISPKLEGSLLPKFFGPADPEGQRSARFLSSLANQVLQARKHLANARSVLNERRMISLEAAREVKAMAKGTFSPSFLMVSLEEANKLMQVFGEVINSFEDAMAEIEVPYRRINQVTFAAITMRMEKVAWLRLENFSLEQIETSVEAVQDKVEDLTSALDKVEAIVNRFNIPFDGSPLEIAKLPTPAGFKDLKWEVPLDEEILATAKQSVKLGLPHVSLENLERLQARFQEAVDSFRMAFERCKETAQDLGVAFDNTPRAIHNLKALAGVAKASPHDLLEYRRQSFAQPHLCERIDKVEEAITLEADFRRELETLFYPWIMPEHA
jgi:hypothetical protein